MLQQSERSAFSTAVTGPALETVRSRLESALELPQGSVTAKCRTGGRKGSRVVIDWGQDEASNVHWSAAIKGTPIIYWDNDRTQIFSRQRDGSVQVSDIAIRPKTSSGQDLDWRPTETISVNDGKYTHMITSAAGGVVKSADPNNQWGIYKTAPNASVAREHRGR